jgi:hypothetical protein
MINAPIESTIKQLFEALAGDEGILPHPER